MSAPLPHDPERLQAQWVGYCNINWEGRPRPSFEEYRVWLRDEVARIKAEEEADPTEWVGHVLLVCGIDAEAKLFAPSTEAILTSGGSVDHLRTALEWMEAKEPTAAVVSAGLAGGLDPALKTGDLIVARLVTDGETTFAADVAWTDRLVELTGARVVEFAVGCDSVATTPAAKAALFADTGAAIVDMESHVAARWAAEQGVPFAVMRVVSDDSAHGLPASAVAGMGEDGQVKVGRVLQGLLRRPAELPALIRTGADVGTAMAALKRAANAAGLYVGFPEDRIFVRTAGGGG